MGAHLSRSSKDNEDDDIPDDLKKDEKNDDDPEIEIEEVDEGMRLVFEKMKKQDYHTAMKREDFQRFARTLSDVEVLLSTYLHTDFNQAQKLHRDLESMMDKDEEEEGEEEQVKTPEDLNEVDAILNSDKPFIREVGGPEDRIAFETMSSSNNLRIKLIISETANTKLEKKLRKVVSPFFSLTSLIPEYGVYHIALGIGPWKIEWNNSGLCIPRVITGRQCMLCADISEIATFEELEEVRRALAKVIVRWNTTMHYSGKPTGSESTGNCQKFIDEIFEAIGLSNIDFPPPLKKYIQRLREKGVAKMIFEMDDDFVEHFKLEKNVVKFRRHIDLDMFVRDLLNKDDEFMFNYRNEYHMLKSFDRAFWMRWLKGKGLFHRLYEKEQEILLGYRPLMQRDLGDEEDEEDEDDDDEEENGFGGSGFMNRGKKNPIYGVLKCPFGDPEKNSINLPVITKNPHKENKLRFMQKE